MKKIAYVLFMSALTTTAVSACYWQIQRYMRSRNRWDVIRSQLNKSNPDDLEGAKEAELYPFKYVSVRGKLAEGFQRVQRARNGRMGYLVVRKMLFGEQENQQIVALQGWCEKGHEIEPKKSQMKEWKGILRQKEKKDYVHTHFKKQDLQKYKMTTYINLETLGQIFKIQPTHLSQNYYIQLLRPLDSTEHESFPYQYSIDNFQLPYLTPDKHLSYATFWGCSSLVGIMAIIRALRLK